MTRLKTAPFADEHLDDAAGLLAARHRAHLDWSPLLDASYEAPAAARDAIEHEWSLDGASGAVALEGGTLVGYLIAAPQPGEAWGTNVLVGSAGAAADRAETIRDLYGAAAQRWVDEGHHRHYALFPAGPADWLDAWWRLSFGCQQVHGIQVVRTERRPPAIDCGVCIRRRTRKAGGREQQHRNQNHQLGDQAHLRLS